jgi:conjugative relaxase-like TrwC/TraI family protein
MVRFSQPGVSASHAIDYFSMHMASDDCLAEQGQSEMVWVGRDAGRLGISGHVQKEEFQRLCEGEHPITGERLGQRERGPVRRVCYFGQISATKEVSIAHLVGGDKRIINWWREAAAGTAREIEAVIAGRLCQGGIDNKDRLTESMVAPSLPMKPAVCSIHNCMRMSAS